MLTVKLLQTPTVTLDGVPVTFPFKRAEALLYYMLVRRSATRQELISLLWESCDEAVGLKNLRNAIYTLKKTLGGEILLSYQKSVLMVNEAWEIDCDYDRFLSEHDYSAYQGPFLQGFSVKNAFSYEEWLGRTRDKLQERYLSGLAKRAEEAQQAGQPDMAQRYATEYLREDPFDETMVTFLMCQYRQGSQYAKAAQVYQRLKDALVSELGATPLESTTMLYYELMNEWNDTTALEKTDEKNCVPVGRENAYAALRAAVVSFRAQPGRNYSQLLSGEVGSGKSELINHFLRNVALDDFLVLRENCILSEQELFLGPWDRMMSTVAQFIREEGVIIPEHVWLRLGRYFSSFAQEGEVASLRHADQTLLDATLLMISAVARRRKVLIILEDMQWCDGQSMILLDTLLRRVESGALMVILTRRDNCVSQVKDRVECCIADGLLCEQRLHPLTCGETEEFLRRELGGEAAGQLAQEFYRETGGNLHLLVELTQAYRLSGNVTEVAASTQDILLNRLAGLGEAALQVAHCISMFPQSAPCAALLVLMRQNDRLLTTGVEELSRRGLIFEESKGGVSSYCFTHQRIRELVYSGQSFFQRRELHLQIAQLISARGRATEDSTECREIAWHYRKGEATLEALSYEIQALELETAQYCELFPVIYSVNGGMRSVEELSGLVEKAQRDLAQLYRDRADETVLKYLERMLILIRGRLALFRGHVEEGSGLLGGLSGDSEPDRDSELMVKACYLLASYTLSIQSADLAERYISTGMRLVERRGDSAQIAMFERLRGNYFCLRAEYDKSIYYLLESIESLGKQTGRRDYRMQIAGAYYDYGRVCRQRQDYVEACSYYKKALALVGEDSHYPGTVWIYVNYGRAVFALEDHSRAQTLFRKGYEVGLEREEVYGLTAAAAYTAYYEMKQGNYAQAAQALNKAQKLSMELDSVLEKGILCFISMKIRAALDRGCCISQELELLLPDPAENYARQGVRILADVPQVFEVEQMARGLKEGISQKRSFRARELYSPNRNFMAE